MDILVDRHDDTVDFGNGVLYRGVAAGESNLAFDAVDIHVDPGPFLNLLNGDAVLSNDLSHLFRRTIDIDHH